MHVVHIMANNSTAPYFNWFAEEAMKHPDITFSFIALYYEKPAMQEEMKKYGAACYWIPYDHRQRKRTMPLAFFKLWKLLRKIKPDIVHTHLFDDSLIGLMAAKAAGVRRRVITKGDTAFHWNYAPKGVKYDRLNNRMATDIVAISEECKNFILTREKADAKKITLIHHGVPVEKVTSQSEETRQYFTEKFGLKNRTVIGTIARLIEWKGYQRIIEAAETVIKTHPDVKFLFIGTGEQEAELKASINAKKLNDHILLTGWVDREKLPSLYGLMDIYLHAASYEPFGFVIAEAMLNGIPVVSTATGAALDVIEHKKNGYLVNEIKPEALAEGICYMLECDNLKETGILGRQKALEYYSFQQMWKNHMSLYNNQLK